MDLVPRLDRRVSASAEAQHLALRATRDIERRTCGQASAGRPGPEQFHGFRYARQVSSHSALEAVDLPAPPAFHRSNVKPSDPDEHVDGAHIALNSKCRFCSLDDTLREWVPVL